jgi:hypothetical protein
MRDFRVYLCKPSCLDPIQRNVIIGCKWKDQNEKHGSILEFPEENLKDFIDQLLDIVEVRV